MPRRNSSPDTNADVRSCADMLATDDARGVVVSFGADEPDRTIAGSWEWDGQRWALISTSPAPIAGLDVTARVQLVFGD